MNRRWIQLEYVGKGIALGLLAVLAFRNPDWSRTGIFFGVTAAGLLLALAIAGFRVSRRGRKVQGHLLAFFLFLLLEHAGLIYAGVLGGMLAGGAVLTFAADSGWSSTDLAAAIGGGAVLGLLFSLSRRLENRWVRSTTVLIVGGAAAVAILFALGKWTDLLEGDAGVLFAMHLLLAVPLVYLLTFTGRAEESELEIGSICVALGVAMWILLSENHRLIAIIAPVTIYYLYLQYVLRRLAVFKYVLRGISFGDMGLHREALKAYRRALQLDPQNALAREGRWRVHKDIDFSQAVHDPETMKLVDLDLCLERAGELLMQSRPSVERLAEAHKLMNLVLDQRPTTQPAVYYWRAVAHTHAKEFDKAEAELRTVLTPSNYPPDDPYRTSVVVPCWQLALIQHPELCKRVGVPLLTVEHRRLDAIADVEKALTRGPDAGAWALKTALYEGLTENEYDVRRGAAKALPSTEFDHQHCLQLGLALMAEGPKWRRGAELLRISACGLPEKAPTIYYTIADVARKAGDTAACRQHEEALKRLAREVGVRNLAEDDQKAFFTTVRNLGDAAYTAGDIDAAIENLSLFVASSDCGVDTLRILAELNEKKGDALSALLWNEKALSLDGRNKLLLERKDKYYYSVMPAQLQENLERAKKWFDVEYCTRKARSLLELKHGGPEQVDWALHLAEIAHVIQPENIQPSVLCARARLRRGEQAEAQALLEQIREQFKEKSLGGEDEEAWFLCSRLLGDLYLQSAGRPDLALACYNDYRKSAKSGADTMFKMGQAYEALGDRAKAAKWYQNVTVYDHPLASDAYMALSRLQSGD
jgi:tetratricopeptide (TPR) repeat protein